MFKILFVILSVWAFAVGADVDPGPEPPCPSDNSIEAYFESNDCTKFWQCSNGVPYLMPCAPETHWSQKLWTCVHIVDSTCTGQGWSSTQAPTTTTTTTTRTPKPTTTTTTTTTPNDSTVKSTTTTTPAPSSNSSNCPAVDGPDSVYFPDEDCTKFWQCSNGRPYQHSCPAGLHFNPVLNVCDWPADAGCNGNGSNDSTVKPTTTTTPAPSSNSSGCPAVDGPDSVYFPDDDCTKFWQCSNGRPIQHTCPDGLHFNPVLNVCDWPANAGCKGTTPETTTAETDKIPCDPVSPDNSDNTTSTEQPTTSTEQPTTTTEQPTTTTEVPTTTTVVPSSTPSKPGPTPSCKPQPTVCTCTCQAIPEDDEPATSIWTTKPTVPETTTPKVTPPGKCDTEANTNSEPETTTAAATTGQDSCNKLSNQCPAVDGPDSVYIPLAYCGGFCQCSNGQAYYHPCPDGLHFNPTLNVCDYPYRAGCTGVSGTTPTTPATNN